MENKAISVHNLSKRYRLGRDSAYLTLVEEMRGFWSRDRKSREGRGEVLALRGVTFDVEEGEVLGVIGRNGSGKSTLLKVLAGITLPSSGRAEVRGRCASLLEVGTGFHGELTGRENIFLNGAILGMSRSDVRRRFDEIVAFAEVERFLDTPVKRYSSGMYMRLAFAVAAHLSADVLLVDEVLAVGDAAFQRKCLDKMRELASGGRTLLFVSHNMSAITTLCRRALLLEAGELLGAGDAGEMASKNLAASWGGGRTVYEGHSQGGARLLGARALVSGPGASHDIREPLVLEADVEMAGCGMPVTCQAWFEDEWGNTLFSSVDTSAAQVGQGGPEESPSGIMRHRLRIPGNHFAEGPIRVGFDICSFWPRYQSFDVVDGALRFVIIDNCDPGSIRHTLNGSTISGVIRPQFLWEREPLPGPQP